MTRPYFLTLKDGVQRVLRGSRTLHSDPDGDHYSYRDKSYSRHLQDLGVMGPAIRVTRGTFIGDQKGVPSYLKLFVCPVDYQRAEEVLDKLNQIERSLGSANERYGHKEAFAQRLKKLRVDLDQLR